MVTVNRNHNLQYYRATPGQEQVFSASELKPLVTKTRAQLAMAFDKRFFYRYTVSAARLSESFIFEM